MARGKWNRTMTVYYGPTSVAGAPGTAYRFDVECRLVYQNQIVQTENPDSLSFAWITYQGPEVHMAKQTYVSPGVYTFDYGAADQVEMDDTPGELLVCLRGEEVFPAPRPDYYRALVARLDAWSPPLPPPPVPPPPTPAPGTTCGAAGVIALNTSYSYTWFPGGPPMWWRVPGGSTGGARWLESNFVMLGGLAFNCTTGPTCGSQTATSQSLVHPGCYVVITATGPDLWLQFLPTPAPTFTFTFKIRNSPC